MRMSGPYSTVIVRRFVGNSFLKKKAVHHHTSEQNVEWLYAFDVHCNSFVPTFMLLYGAPFLTERLAGITGISTCPYLLISPVARPLLPVAQTRAGLGLRLQRAPSRHESPSTSIHAAVQWGSTSSRRFSCATAS